jgi:outer membrane protein OmpA-like peptidoglycan-associated protein
MHIHIKLFKVAPLLLAAFALTACGNVSRNVHKDGQSADSINWPALGDTTPMHKDGTFPNLDNLARVHAGLNKQQISDLIGYPHFSEGVWGVREWNYVFHFREPVQSNQVVTCQFKVLFDTDKLAQRFYWMPEECSRFQQPARAPAPPPAVVAPAVSTERFTLGSDALFAFDRAGASDMSAEGRAKLDKLAQGIQQHAGQVQSVRVVGYTDRLGSDAYNDDLSQRRADTVKSYLVSRGVSSSVIQADGRGKRNPVAECVQAERGALIACLAANRRVEVLVTALKTETRAN